MVKFWETSGLMPRFKDAPLGKDRFRLFRFEPHSSDVEIIVKTFKIYRAPEYEAVSYCWGDKADGVARITSNHEPLEVWNNLHAALCRLRRENTAFTVTRWYWNDAICIEQGDSEVAIIEKALQIAFMETIFLLAKPVRVWLGDASLQEEQTFGHLVSLCESGPEDQKQDVLKRFPNAKDKTWLYWAQIILRPWFARLWVVQEALVSAGNVVVTLGSNARCTWTTFSQLLRWTQNVPWLDERITYEDLDTRAQSAFKLDFMVEWGITLDTYQQRGKDRNEALTSLILRNCINIQELLFLEKYHDPEFGFLQQVLKVFGNRKCTYDQDRPNAMRGVLPERLKADLKVYNVKSDVAMVYREVSQVWLANDPTLSLLNRIRPLGKFLPANDSSGTEMRNPSWAIDLSRVTFMTLGNGIPFRVDGFHAGMVKDVGIFGKGEWTVPQIGMLSRLQGAKHVKFPDEKECHIMGVQIATVDSVISYGKLETLYTRSLAMEHNDEFNQWLDGSFNLVNRTIADIDKVAEVHWRSLILNAAYAWDPEVNTVFDIEDKHSRRQAYDQVLTLFQSGRAGEITRADHNVQSYYSEAYSTFQAFPNYFSTSTDHIGRSRAVPVAGDVVAVFLGSTTPFLLRPVPGRSTFEYMGEAYIHGLMQGEALKDENKARYPKRLFKIV